MQKDQFLNLIKTLKKPYFTVKAILLKNDNRYLLTNLQITITNNKSSIKQKDFGSIVFYEKSYPISEFNLIFCNIINKRWTFNSYNISFELFLDEYYCDFRQIFNAQSEYDMNFSCFVYRIEGNPKIEFKTLFDKAEQCLVNSNENYQSILQASKNILGIKYARATLQKIVFIVPIEAKIKTFQSEENIYFLLNVEEKQTNFYFLSIYSEDENGIRTGFKFYENLSNIKNNIVLKKSDIINSTSGHGNKNYKIFLKFNLFLLIDNDKWNIDFGIAEIREDLLEKKNVVNDNIVSNKRNDVKIDDLIYQIESKILGKKSSMLSKKDGTRTDENRMNNIIESITSFLNSNKGIILIGVNPENEIVGIEREYEFVSPKNFDGWNIFLTNKIISKFKDNTILNNVNVYCEKYQEHDVGILYICKHYNPVFIDENIFYIRTPVGKTRLKTNEIYEYIKNNFDK